MVHQARTGEVEELLALTSFPAALELPRYTTYLCYDALLSATNIFFVFMDYTSLCVDHSYIRLRIVEHLFSTELNDYWSSFLIYAS